MKSPDARPEVSYNSFFSGSSLMRVTVDGAVCGRLLKVLATPQSQISRTTIQVVPEQPKPFSEIQFDDSGRTNLFVFPTRLWNDYQAVLGMSQLVTKREATVHEIVGQAPVLMVSKRNLSIPEAKTDEVKMSLGIKARQLFPEEQEALFLDSVFDQQTDETKRLLSEALNRRFRAVLAEGLIRSLDKPNQFLENLRRDLILYGPLLASGLAVFGVRQLPGISEVGLFDSFLTTSAALGTYYFTAANAIRWVDLIDPRQIRARGFAKAVSADPIWQNLGEIDFEPKGNSGPKLDIRISRN